MRSLAIHSEEKLVPNGIPCVSLVHNEENIINEFLAHYRSLGPISFLIVDDHSTDSTCSILLRQNDVTVFRPILQASYSTQKALWRKELLDQYASNRWCLVPDIDEHLIYTCFERRTILDLIDDLEREHAHGLFSIMVDMYDDRPLSQHKYDGGGLREAFPFFDGPCSLPSGYSLIRKGNRHLRKYPTPEYFATGGLRWRLFFSDSVEVRGHAIQWLLRNRCSVDRIWGSGRKGTLESWVIRRAKHVLRTDVLNIAKIPLLIWPTGAMFSGGTHSVNTFRLLSRETGALLHYKFTRGVDGFEYIATRGLHYGGSVRYRAMLRKDISWASSPVCSQTELYSSSHSMRGIIARRCWD